MGFLFRTPSDKSILEMRRLAAFARIRRGEPLAAIARSLGVSRQAVHQWAQSVRERGAASLRRKPMGRPPKLSRKQMTHLWRLLAKTPTYYGFPEQGWSPMRVSELIYQQFGVRYDLYYIRPLLARFGWRRWSKKI
ncbi:MAG: helix-turn-helix domain-containing protein [Candidatus Acidiferrum sp.]|jgi:transposase